MTQEEISLSATKGKETYDECVKENLQYVKLLAPILQLVVPEYEDCSIDEVINYIEADSICDDAVDDVSIKVQQKNKEMNSISEKLVTYDSRFKAKNPKLSNKDIAFYLHIDLEVQKTYKPSNPSYPIIKRGIYYGAREISSQLGILTNVTNYDKLEKVYSIWICNENIPQNLENTVSLYKICKNDLIGSSSEPEADYDLLDVIIIRRGKNASTEKIFDYLTSFFSGNIDKICEYVDIKSDDKIMKGVKRMGGLGQSIYDKGHAEGHAEGEDAMKNAMKLIYESKCSTVEELINNGVPLSTAQKALAK